MTKDVYNYTAKSCLHAGDHFTHVTAGWTALGGAEGGEVRVSAPIFFCSLKQQH